MTQRQIELMNDIKAMSGCKIAHMSYTSIEKLPKYLGLGVVSKVVSGEVQVNYDYENAVNNHLEKKGLPRTFKTSSLRWGVWETLNKIISHNGNYYLRFYIMKNKKLDATYYVDGRPMTDAEYAIMKAYKDGQDKGSNKQKSEGLDEGEQVIPRDVNFDGIISFKCGEIKYDLYAVAV